MKITKPMIREWLGHNGAECRGRIKQNGEVHRIGNGHDPLDRGRDYWHYCGMVEDVARDMASAQGLMEYELEG